jgi:mRNA-degrading endonuclease RelE of RelBE toxin-antitoxin system
MKFSKYLQENEESEKDLKRTLKKIPEKHRALVRDYKISFEPNNTLANDKKHIGLIDEKNKKIVIASPWNYGREYTLLHEIGHAVWRYIVDSKAKKEWEKLFEEIKKKNKKDLNQNYEEIFCMIYAQVYAKNKLEKYNHKKLINFILKL